MTTMVRADEKGRISLRGSKKGQEYLVTSDKNGWRITEAKRPDARKRGRQWTGSKISLVEHLRGLAESGLTLERSKISQQRVPKCRF